MVEIELKIQSTPYLCLNMDSIERYAQKCMIVAKLLHSLETFALRSQGLRSECQLTDRLTEIANKVPVNRNIVEVARTLSTHITTIPQPRFTEASLLDFMKKLNALTNNSVGETAPDPSIINDDVYEFLVEFEAFVSATCHLG